MLPRTCFSATRRHILYQNIWISGNSQRLSKQINFDHKYQKSDFRRQKSCQTNPLYQTLFLRWITSGTPHLAGSTHHSFWWGEMLNCRLDSQYRATLSNYSRILFRGFIGSRGLIYDQTYIYICIIIIIIAPQNDSGGVLVFEGKLVTMEQE